MVNVRIKDLEIYHGKKVISNEFYLEYFKKRDKDIEHYLKDIMGRNKRYVLENEKENSVTMCIEAAKMVLKKANLTGQDIDMIIFSSQLPEYIAPPSSIFVHRAIEGKRETICKDINVNCAGMLVALDHTSKYMKVSDNIKYALIVGCDYVNMILNKEDELSYGNYGDAACAILLEKTAEDAGVIDSKYYINNEECENILFPGCGFSNIFKVDNKEDILLQWHPFNGSACVGPAVEAMTELMSRNNLTKENIKAFCLSQFAYKNIELIQKRLEINDEQIIYIGDEYGYTGTSSPFIALNRGIETGYIKKGDYIMFWTIGAGSESVTILYRY